MAAVEAADMALQVEDIVEGEAEATTAVVAGAPEAAGAVAVAAVKDTTATTRVEEDGAVPAASESTTIAPRPIM